MKKYLAVTWSPICEGFDSTTRGFDTAEEAMAYADKVYYASEGEILVDVYEATQIN